MCLCLCVAKPVAVELRCHATALIFLESPNFNIMPIYFQFSFAISKLQCYSNYVLENWIAVVGFGGVALALAIVVFTTILVVKYKVRFNIFHTFSLLSEVGAHIYIQSN